MGSERSAPMASESETDRSGAAASEGASGGPLLASAAVRGGRFLMPLAGALGQSAARVTAEYNLVRERRLILLEHSVCLRHAIMGLGEDELAAVAPLGYRAEDFETAFFDAAPGEHPGKALLVLATWADPAPNLFRHKASGMIIPYRPMRGAADTPAHREVTAWLDAEFKPFTYDEAEYKFTLRLIFSKIPEGGLLFVVRQPETRLAPDGSVQPHRPRARMNQWCAEAAELYPNVRMIDLATFADESAGGDGGPEAQVAAPGEPEGGLTAAAAERLARHMVAAVQAEA